MARLTALRRIPSDVIQNTVEYASTIADVLSWRDVSTGAKIAVSDAIGFLNERCWDKLRYHWRDVAVPVLAAHLSSSVGPASTVQCTVWRCAVLCLWPRLEELEWVGAAYASINVPLALLSRNGAPTALKLLTLDSAALLNAHLLRDFQSLKELCLRCPSQLKQKHVGAVAKLTQLEVLDLHGNANITDVTPFAALVALKRLDLGGTNIDNGSFVALATVTTLTELVLSGCHKVTSVAPLLHVKLHLSLLDLHVSTVTELRNIDRLPALTTLDLTGCSQLRDTFGINNCAALRELRCVVTPQSPISVETIAQIATLERLNLTLSSIREVGALQDCASLRVLDLTNTQVTNAGVLGLERIGTLEVLKLIRCKKLTLVTGLANCPVLRELDLSSSSVKSVSGLERIPTLEVLDLACTAVWNVTSLRHCPSLRHLDLSGTGIGDDSVDALQHIATLETLVLYGCDVFTVSPLRHCHSLVSIDLRQTDVTDGESLQRDGRTVMLPGG
jgi:Leucine-rich repeat (LRR) protein